MRRFIFLAAFASLSFFAFGQQASVTATSRKVLFVYEEENEKLLPWIASFREQLGATDVAFDECPAKEAPSADMSLYDTIVVCGAVMAFASNEPVRDWLSMETRLAGKNVALLVTANRWSLKKYFGQLTALLDKKSVTTVDAISSATKDLSEAEKKSLVKKTVAAAVGNAAR